jgi:hypothetical protein
MKKLTVLSFVALMAFAVPVYAQDASNPAPVAQTKHGHGGGTTEQAYMARSQQKFEAMDTNHDGVISPQERKAAKAQRKADRENRKALKGH